MGKVNYEEMLELRKKGVNCKDLAQKYNVHPSSISKALKTLNVKGRNPNMCLDVFNSGVEADYWLGFLMADGSIREHNGGISICLELAIKDIKHLEKFKSFIRVENKIEITKKGKACRIRVGNRELGLLLKTKGIIPSKTFKAKLLDTSHLSFDFSRGYIDGDGSIGIYDVRDKRDNRIYRQRTLTIVGTKSILTQIDSVINTNNKITKEGKFYRLTKSGSKLVPILKRLYYPECVTLNRKRDIAERIIRGE